MKKHTACRTIVVLFLCTFLLLGVACSSGPGSAGENELPIGDFQKQEAEGYQFPDLPWGASREEASDGMPLGESSTPPMGGQTFLASQQKYTLEGQSASAELEFFNDKLGSIAFEFTLSPDDTAWYTERLEDLTALYGDPDSRADHAIGNGETCRWTAEDSELQLSSLPTNKQILVTVKLVSKDVVDAYVQAAS